MEQDNSQLKVGGLKLDNSKLTTCALELDSSASSGLELDHSRLRTCAQELDHSRPKVKGPKDLWTRSNFGIESKKGLVIDY